MTDYQRTVTTQDQLDKAIADGVTCIDIRSAAGAWIEVTAYDSAMVTAYDSATVTAYGSATVRAYGSATVTAYGSSTVRAYGSATVTAYGSATVRAYDSATVTASGSATVTAYGSATVTAYDSSTVTASGSATVTAYDSATVRAYGSATVRAYDSATVRAYDSATVTAYGSATVRAYDSATVTASALVAVHLHSGRATISGGVLIDHTQEPTDPAAWCDYHGITVTGGIATVYKAVNDRWTTSRGVDYAPGSLPDCDDWRDDHECGGGLHFSPTPGESMAYHREATRFVAVGIDVATMRPIVEIGATAKCKAPSVVRACVEVDIDGNVIA